MDGDMSEQQGAKAPQGLRRRFGSSTTSRLEQRVVEGIHAHSPTTPESEGPSEKPAARKKVWIIVGAAAVVVLILGGVIVGMLSRPRGVGGGDAGGQTPGATAAQPTSPAGSDSTPVFQFLPPQEHPVTGWTGFETLVGDVNGDGRADLIWNLTAESNLIYVALAGADGAFSFPPMQERTEKRWGGFGTLAGDVNGDGRTDLIWNETAETNRIYVALGGTDGVFQFLPAQDRPEQRWSGFRTLVGDVNGDGRSDLIWNETAETNRVYVALGNADGTFQFLPAQDHPDEGWGGFETLVGDVNGDGRTDLVWSPVEETGRVAVALANSDGTWLFLPAQEHAYAGQAGFEMLIGDVNGDGRADLVWNACQETNRTIVALASNDGTLAFLPPQERAEPGWQGFTAHIADMDGDGRDDLVWNKVGTNNRTYLGLGTSEGILRFLPAQDHPEQGWEGYRLLLGDIDGDGRSDLVWNAVQEGNRIVVGLSTP
jgi:hypothetical protein